MTRIVSGANISSPNVDPNKDYIDGRSIANLDRLGALDPKEKELAKRVDGIIDNSPVDGFDQIDELITMEQPSYFATLFPAEQRLLPQLWKSLELDPITPAVAGSYTPLAPLDSLIQLQTTLGGLDLNKSIPISKLPTQVQTEAKRIQLVLNSDADATTISLADVRSAMSAPGRFTRSDTSAFKMIEKKLEELLRLEPSQMSASLQVPEPGRTSEVIPHSGQAEFKLVTEVKIHDSFKWYSKTLKYDQFGRRSRTVDYPIQLERAEVQRSQTIEVTVPPGHKMALLNLDKGSEKVFDAGQKDMELESGKYRVELWQNGTRVESSEVIIPERKSKETHSIRDYVGVPMVAGSVPLQRVYRTDKFKGEYVTQGSPNTRAKPISAFNYLKTKLPPGVYEIPDTTSKLHIYDSKLFSIVNAGGQETFLYPYGPDTGGRVGVLEGLGAYPRTRYSVEAQGDFTLYVSPDNVRKRTYVRLSNRIA